MGIGGLFGGLLGGGAAASQQAENLQWQLANTSNAGTWNNTYVVSTYPVEAAPVKAKGPETALEWLDRRIAEVRLPLAA